MDDIRLLRVLREVALRGSFSAAAEALDYSQPAVSQQIARLEKQVGVRLLDRDQRGIRLTTAGEVLVRHTEKLLAQLAAAEAELADVAAEARGRVRVGAFATASGTIVPEAVVDFRKRRPAVAIELDLIDPPDAVPALRRGDLDIAIVETHGFGGLLDLEGLQIVHLMDDPLYVALPTCHPFATRTAISLEELAEDEWMLVGSLGTCADTNIVLSACRDAGFEPNVAHSSHDYFAIQGLVASGIGVALVPGLGLVSQRDDIAVRPLAGSPPRRRVAAAIAPGESPAHIAAMVDCLREAAKRFESAERSAALAA
jgi:DNA-binding transcriptional LysR family regulator